MFPALPRRAGSASLVSLIADAEAGEAGCPNTSTRWPRGAGGSERRKRSVSSRRSAIRGCSGFLGYALGYKPGAHWRKCVRTSAHTYNP